MEKKKKAIEEMERDKLMNGNAGANMKWNMQS